MEPKPVNSQTHVEAIQQVTSVSQQERSPAEGRVSKVLRPFSRALGIVAFTAAALGPGKAEAMDQNTKSSLYGLGAAVLAQKTGVVLRPGINGDPVLDVNTTMRNREIMEQQKKQQEQRRAIEQAAQQPTQVSFSNEAKAMFEQNNITFTPAGGSFYIWNPDNPAGREFLNNISSSGVEVKYTSIKLGTAAPNVLTVEMSYFYKNTGQKVNATQVIRYDVAKKAFLPM